MKKFLLVVIMVLCVVCGLHINNLYAIVINHRQVMASRDEGYYEQMRTPVEETKEDVEIFYNVYISGEFDRSFPGYADAVEYASGFANASIYENHTSSWAWDNFPPYELNVNNVRIMYSSFEQARADAENHEDATITFKNTSNIIWNKQYEKKGVHLIDVPLIHQFPELPRGCEVVSLAMLINYKGIEIDKLQLAEEVEKHDNNPSLGFVGDMYNLSKPGYGVYHAPIFKLLHKYLPESAMDLTGCDFDDLYYFLDNNNPIWIITNSTYKPLGHTSFVKWKTDDGNTLITYKEHSILVTGYDEEYIYFNDPYGTSYKAEKTDFIKAWEQMGRQAVTTADVVE